MFPGKLLLLVVLGGFVGWICVQAVTLDTKNGELNITVDTQKFKQASRDAVQQGRRAVAKAGEYLERTGQKLEQARPAEPAPAQVPAAPSRLTWPWSRPQNAPTG